MNAGKKAEVQKRFNTDHGDFIALIGEGIVQVHGKVPAAHECMTDMHRRAWRGPSAAIQDHPTLKAS